MDKDGTVVVADYGLSRQLQDGQEDYLVARMRFAWAWSAPETMKDRKCTMK